MKNIKNIWKNNVQERGVMEDITVKQLEELISNVFQQREIYEEAKAKSAEEYSKLQELQNKAMSMLEELEIDSYKAKVGTFSYTLQESFKVPKDTENREKFFQYLKEKGVYEHMITINSRTLNAFAKEEMLAAENKGELDFNIPGLEKTDPQPVYRLRKSK